MLKMLPLAQVYTPVGLSCSAGAGGGAMAEFHHPNVPDMEAKWDIWKGKGKTGS